MWKALKILALLATLPLACGVFTHFQSTHAGPFSYFQSKYPNLSGQSLLDVANKEIYEYSKNVNSLERISAFMNNAGFDRSIYAGVDLQRRTWGSMTKAEYLFSYRYGAFSKTHAWVFSVLEQQDGTLNLGRSFQVCTACP